MSAAQGAAERVLASLRTLYTAYGYRQYKVGKFEEYDLYARNKSFLTDERILTFSDLNGKLMALKPDVTLSIIKNTRGDDRTRKVWYTENVYRAPRGAYGFQEIVQTGLECIGAVDLYAMAEVLMLAARSLEAVSPDYVLSLSHMGILTGVLNAAHASPALTADILSAVSQKNTHGLRALCVSGGLAESCADLLEKLCLLDDAAQDVLPRLTSLPLPEESRAAAQELAELCRLLDVFGVCGIEIDLSLINDTDYYNGVLFRGFVDGASAYVLSGGRYDHLLHRMGKPGEAIGFALYMSELERLFTEKRDYDVDTLLVYDETDDPARVALTARTLTESGQTVRVQRRGTPAVTYRRKIGADGREAE